MGSALVATAPACSKPDSSTPDAGITTDTSHAAVTSASAPATVATLAPMLSATADDPKLVALRDDLASAGRDKALAATSRARFRPLCDAQGYPLVGNLARKVPTPDFGPSEFCTEIRKAEKRQ